MTTSDSRRGFRQRLLDYIDSSGISDRRVSLLATGSTDAVRRMRRGSWPSLDTVEAICRVLGFRLETVPLDERVQAQDGAPAIERYPKWSWLLREEIHRDLVEALGRSYKGAPGRTGRSRITEEKILDTSAVVGSSKGKRREER